MSLTSTEAQLELLHQTPSQIKPEVTYIVVLKEDEDGRFVATCPQLQGMVTDGATDKEAMENSRDAIKAILEDMNDMKEFNLVSYIVTE